MTSWDRPTAGPMRARYRNGIPLPPEEMPMGRTSKLPRPVQLELFREHPMTPTWAQLPEDARQRAHRLLASLLRSHRRAHCETDRRPIHPRLEEPSMTPDDVRAAADQLLRFHDRFAPTFGKPQAQDHAHDYVKGL